MTFALNTAEPAKVLWDLRHWVNRTFELNDSQAAITVLVFAVLCMIVPYLLGSINPAIIISKLLYRDDVRQHGSGNAGSTNMLRTYGTKAGALTFICDMLKTVIAMVIGRLLLGEIGMSLSGFFAGFGHMFPIYYKFKGGKGVACYATVALMISPLTFLGILFIFIVVLVGTKFVSLASVMAAIFYPLLLNAFAHDFALGVAMAVVETCFVVFMHRANLKRIWNYEENKFDFSKFKRKKKPKAEASEENTATETKDGGRENE